MPDSHTTEPDEALTAQEVARILRVTPAALRQWRYKRVGPPWIRLGKLVRYRRSDLTAWLAGFQAHQSSDTPWSNFGS